MPEETTSLVPAIQNFMPIMSVRDAVDRRRSIVDFIGAIMIADHDFGIIPGTAKPTLLKPGAEKLATYFGLTPVYVLERGVEHFGDDGTEPLFFYRYRCELYRNGLLAGSGIGSCNSRETRYRYRNAQKACPECGASSIMRSKYPPRDNPNAQPGWYCYSKQGGCGANFTYADVRITQQVTGKVPNTDIADLVNTVDKMAQKRSFIAAVLVAVNASEFYTQDIEDIPALGGVIDGVAVPVEEPSSASAKTAESQAATAKATASNGKQPPMTPKEMQEAYQAAKKYAKDSGKFSNEAHLDAAWKKMFQDNQAHVAENARKFIAAWVAYVDGHDAPKSKTVPVKQPAPAPAPTPVPTPSAHGPTHDNASPDEIGESVDGLDLDIPFGLPDDDDGEAADNPFIDPAPTPGTGDYLRKK